MRGGWDRRRLRRAASALMALTLLPVAGFVASAHANGTSGAPTGGSGMYAGALRAQDVPLPMTDALLRGEASGLFAPFGWNGRTVAGPFVQFDYLPSAGQVVGYFATDGANASLLVNTIGISGFTPASAPTVWGSTFIAAGEFVNLVAHDEPTALLEIQSEGRPQTVVFQFPSTTTGIRVDTRATWPRYSLAFTVGAAHGRLILGRGTLIVNGTTATAEMLADDYVALRALPSFARSPAERAAVLDGFASGRLAAEYNYVAISSGGWLQNEAEFQSGVYAASSSVGFSRATVTLGPLHPGGGLVLLAFDPLTMPADARHQLRVTNNGVELPESASPLDTLRALPGSPYQSGFARLPMNATVIVVSLPDLTDSHLEVQSIALPPPGVDMPTELAMIAAAFIVSVAAAVMFRRPTR